MHEACSVPAIGHSASAFWLECFRNDGISTRFAEILFPGAPSQCPPSLTRECSQAQSHTDHHHVATIPHLRGRLLVTYPILLADAAMPNSRRTTDRSSPCSAQCFEARLCTSPLIRQPSRLPPGYTAITLRIDTPLNRLLLLNHTQKNDIWGFPTSEGLFHWVEVDVSSHSLSIMEQHLISLSSPDLSNTSVLGCAEIVQEVLPRQTPSMNGSKGLSTRSPGELFTCIQPCSASPSGMRIHELSPHLLKPGQWLPLAPQ